MKQARQSETMRKSVEKDRSETKKDGVKNAKKTRGRPFTSENQPEKKGRPAGSKDFSTIFDEVSKGEGRSVAIGMLWQRIKSNDFQALKLAIEYLFERPKETVLNETTEPLKFIITSDDKNSIDKI